jgi:DNA-binding transcriptional ArsR family regulator
MEKLFKALASEPRRRILEHLIEGPMTVGEVGNYFDMALPSISKHLAILRDAGLIREQKRGQYVFYSLVPDALANLLYGFLTPFCAEAGRIAGERKLGKRKG